MAKFYILICIILLMPGCSLLGMKFGEALDRSSAGDPEDRHRYKAHYLVEGLKWDVEIARAILSRPEKEAAFDVDTGRCQEQGRVQVCSVRDGCNCEKYIKSHYNTLEIR